MNLDVATSSANSLNDFLSPLSMERPRARNEGCSGLHNQKHFKYIYLTLQTSNSNIYKLSGPPIHILNNKKDMTIFKSCGPTKEQMS
jgi:hypothetical protein